MILPRLYKKTKTGAVQQWKISTEDNLIVVTFGQWRGKQQVKETLCDGKNIGRANETSDNQQAEIEAQAKWEKQIKAGYVEDPSGVSKIKLPMKVKKYQGQEKNIIFPCYASPKLNGVNGEWRKTSSVLKLLSRGGKEYPILEHERSTIEATMRKIGTDNLNVELYCHGMFLEEITSAVKKYNKNTPRIQSFLFELPTVDVAYERKTTQMTVELSHLPVIPIIQLYSHKEIVAYHKRCVEEGYEGIVIRNGRCRYEYGVRSSDAFKLKVALDAEFRILDYSVDKNGHPVFVMDNPKGIAPQYKTFKCKPKGTDVKRKLIITEFDEKHKDQWYTVEFESWSMYGVPLKPVGIGLRECDGQGEPLE
jgi:hypothetical protein